MNWIDKLERRFGRYSGIPHLMDGILAGQILAWVVIMFLNRNLYFMLMLDRASLMHGQIWKLISFLFMPELETNPLWFALAIYFLWWVGNSLENAWGEFRFTLYWVVGILGAWASCLLCGFGSNSGMLLSLFFAYAWMWPEQTVVILFVLPVKVKWLGIAAAVFYGFQFLTGSLPTKIALLFGLSSFLAFFGGELFRMGRNGVRDYHRRQQWKNNFK